MIAVGLNSKPIIRMCFFRLEERERRQREGERVVIGGRNRERERGVRERGMREREGIVGVGGRNR